MRTLLMLLFALLLLPAQAAVNTDSQAKTVKIEAAEIDIGDFQLQKDIYLLTSLVGEATFTENTESRLFESPIARTKRTAAKLKNEAYLKKSGTARICSLLGQDYTNYFKLYNSKALPDIRAMN